MHRRTYNWNQWFAGKRFVLQRGRDFTCSMASIAQQVRNAASLRKVSASIVEQDDRLVVYVDRGTEDAESVSK